MVNTAIPSLPPRAIYVLQLTAVLYLVYIIQKMRTELFSLVALANSCAKHNLVDVYCTARYKVQVRCNSIVGNLLQLVGGKFIVMTKGNRGQICKQMYNIFCWIWQVFSDLVLWYLQAQ